jgi:diguanylate cyclase (GGDEF)-like protein
MNAASFLGLVQNTALLLAAAFIFDVAASGWRTKRQSLFQQAPLGFAIGAIGITVMMTPWTFMPGIVFDTRSVLIGISGLFFGSFSAAIAMAMTAAFRFYQGGTGAWTGVAVILASGLIGIVWRHTRRRPLAELSWRELYVFGLVIHLAMLGLMLTLPWVTALRVLSSIGLPVILIYPLGTALLGVLMVNRLRREHAEEELRKSENRYRKLSIVDGLTQLYNSRHFYQQLKMEADRADRYGQPLTMLLIDLDDFKQFNDAYGHVEGDHVLMRLGQVIKRCLRQTDSAYRYGGEEFTILLPMSTGRDCIVTAERIRAEFKKEAFSPVAGIDVHLTVSIGIAQYKPQEDMEVFVNRVDQLMYRGKKNGKDSVCFEP